MRTLQSQAGWCVRVQWTLAAAIVAMALGFYLFGYRPADSQLRELRGRMSAKQSELNSNQSRARNLPIVALEVDKLRVRLDRFDKKLPRQQELGQFIRDITQLSHQSDLRRLTVQPSVPRRAELFSELPISLNFEGDFTSVFDFLRHTEEMQRLTRVRSITVRTRDSKLGQVDVQLSMNIYFSEG